MWRAVQASPACLPDGARWTVGPAVVGHPCEGHTVLCTWGAGLSPRGRNRPGPPGPVWGTGVWAPWSWWAGMPTLCLSFSGYCRRCTSSPAAPPSTPSWLQPQAGQDSARSSPSSRIYYAPTVCQSVLGTRRQAAVRSRAGGQGVWEPAEEQRGRSAEWGSLGLGCRGCWARPGEAPNRLPEGSGGFGGVLWRGCRGSLLNSCWGSSERPSPQMRGPGWLPASSPAGTAGACQPPSHSCLSPEASGGWAGPWLLWLLKVGRSHDQSAQPSTILVKFQGEVRPGPGLQAPRQCPQGADLPPWPHSHLCLAHGALGLREGPRPRHTCPHTPCRPLRPPSGPLAALLPAGLVVPSPTVALVTCKCTHHTGPHLEAGVGQGGCLDANLGFV